MYTVHVLCVINLVVLCVVLHLSTWEQCHIDTTCMNTLHYHNMMQYVSTCYSICSWCGLPHLQDSWTPCYLAAWKGHLEMTRLLINYGASRHRRTKVWYYDTLTIKLYVWNARIKKCMHKLLFVQHEIYLVEGIWYMYLYNELSIF